MQSQTGAALVIASNDHCPPHIHALHKSQFWVVRLWFSFASPETGIMSIAPTSNQVTQRQLNQMLDEMTANLPKCRETWWAIQATTCLDNKWTRPSGKGALKLLPARHEGALQVRHATYDAATATATITFTNATNYMISGGASA